MPQAGLNNQTSVMNSSPFGPSKGNAGNGLDTAVKQVSAATVKFSNDKILKAVSYYFPTISPICMFVMVCLDWLLDGRS